MKKSKIVTAFIICLILFFALLVAYTIFRPELPWNIKLPVIGTIGGGQQQGQPQAGAGQQPPNAAAGQQPAGAGQQGGQRQQDQQQGQPSQSAAGQQGAAQNVRGAQLARNAITVRVTPVIPDTIEKTLIINGDVLARNQVSIFPAVAGKLVEVRFDVGDRVNRGAIVAMVDPSRPGDVYSRNPVTSTVSGTVLQAPYTVGDTVTTQSAVYVVGDLSALRVETFVPERFVSSIRPGLSAQVRFEGIPLETFSAVIDEVSPVLDPASRTLRIRLRFVDRVTGRNSTDPRIKAGMFATVSLVTNSRTNVPVIPRTSAINTYGSWIVFTVDENNIARRHVVELGLENEDLFEVLSGVSLGDRVVSAGQNFLSNGDLVRIVE